MKKKISKEKSFQYKLKSRYGITPTQYFNMLLRQKGCCAICGKGADEEKRHFAVDHNHKSGFIRGILCNYCNSRLMRYLRDNKRRADGLVSYLTKALRDDYGWKN